tara:strand:+ start:76 stop:192 length:117 start_codon:yes stop_codon:yes gene_type:complete
MNKEIKPIRTYKDKKGNWWVEFKAKDLKELIQRFKRKK